MRAKWAAAGAALLGLTGTGCVGTMPWVGGPVESKPIASPMPGTGAQEPQELPANASASLSLKMAESLEKEGKETDALVYYENARQQSPALNDRAARRLAILYDRHDQQAKAMVEFQELLKKHPKDSTLLNDVGYSLYNRGQWAEAEAMLRRAVAADKGNKRAWINLGMALAQQNKPAEAVEAFTKAVTPAEAYANLGFVFAGQAGKHAEAVQAYRQALTLEPTLPVAREALAKLERQAQADAPVRP